MNEKDSAKKSLSPALVVVCIVAIAAGLIIGKGILLGGTKRGSDAVPPAAGPPPPDFEIQTMDGRTIKLSDYRGKVLVVDFWATWCPPCQQETPHLVRIATEGQASGVEVVGLHIDDRGRSTPRDISDFIAKYKIPYTIGRATNRMFIAYLGTQDDAIPQTLVFGRDGRLMQHLSGYSEQDGQALDAAVKRALAAS